MMCKLILALFVCIVITCTPGVDGMCCKSIMALVENKHEAFRTLCAQGNTLPAGCCDDIQTEVESFENAYKSLCLNATELCTNPQPLGMESKSIPNSAITASSTWPGYYTYYVRPGQTNCWYAESGKEKNSWIQVDLGKRTTFTGLETQGCSSGWTTTYSVSFSVDGNRWFKYEENSATKVFQGNTDATSKVRKSLKVPVTTRYIRWFPISWHGSYPLIRMELYGCR